VQFGVSPRVIAAIEFGYLTGGEDFSGFGVDIDTHAIAVNANAHYLFASNNERLTPYALGGLGYLRFSASASAGAFSADASDATFGVNVGGGLRWKAGERWGVRPEVKIFIADGTNVQFTAGVYYRFGS
jgi:opacity protein-like surface antigen